MATIAKMAIELGADVRGLRKGLDEGARDIRAFSSQAEKVGSGMKSIGTRMTLGLTLPILAFGAGAITAANNFDLAMTGVAKTVDATEEELAAMGREFQLMSEQMPTSAGELAGVAEAAGQLGVATENVVDFTKVMADMGVSTNLSAEEAAVAIARMANITGMAMTDVDRLGSVIVDLGNNSATTEREILEMGLRISGAGSQIGLAEHETLAFAAALSSVGIEAQAGGTAISRVMVDMAVAVDKGGDKLNLFAAVAGQSASEFQRAFKDDAAGAIADFIEGLAGLDAKGVSTFEVLEELGFAEVRVRDALLRASGASDLLRNSLETAEGAWHENIALSEEAAKFYAADANQLKALRNMIVNTAAEIGTVLIPMFRSMVQGARTIIEAIRPLIQAFAEAPAPIQAVGFAFVGLLTFAGPMLWFLGTVVTLLSSLGLGFTAVLGPVALAVAAFLSIVAAVTAVIDNWGVLKFELQQLVKRFAAAHPELVSGWNAFRYEVGVATEKIVGFVQSMWTRVKEIFSENVGLLIGEAKRFGSEVVAPFKWMYDVIVGNSIVPDLIQRIRGEFSELDVSMVQPTVSATAIVSRSFATMSEQVTRDLRKIAQEKRRTAAVVKEQMDLGIVAAQVEVTGSRLPSQTPHADLGDDVRGMIEAAQSMGLLFEELPEEMRTKLIAWSERDAEIRESFRQGMAQKDKEEGPGLISGALSGILDGMKSFFGGMIQAFNPVTIVAQVFGEALRTAAQAAEPLIDAIQPLVNVIANALAPVFEALAPVLQELQPVVNTIAIAFAAIVEALIPVFQALLPIIQALMPIVQIVTDIFRSLAPILALMAQIISATLVPILELLAPPLRLLSIGISYVVEALGWFIKALGNFIDSIVPDWISEVGKGLARMGEDMMEGARAAREGLDWTADSANNAADALDTMTAGLTNVPAIFDIALRRRMAAIEGAGINTTTTTTVDSSPITTPGTGGTGGTPPVTIEINNPPAAMDVERTKQQLVDAFKDPEVQYNLRLATGTA